jgi:cytochrome c oxidase subunit 2
MIVGTDVEIPVDPMEPGEATYTFSERGEYLIQCHIYCGGGHQTMLGTVIVE